jgi:hypothetical protein
VLFELQQAKQVRVRVYRKYSEADVRLRPKLPFSQLQHSFGFEGTSGSPYTHAGERGQKKGLGFLVYFIQ